MKYDCQVTGIAGMNKLLTGFSNLFFTDMTSRLNEMYGIDEAMVSVHTLNSPLMAYTGRVPVPITRDTTEKLRSVSIMHIARQHEANKVIQDYLELVGKIGQFAALAYDDVAEKFSAGDARIASEEPYFRLTTTKLVNGKPTRVLELTDRLFPV